MHAPRSRYWRWCRVPGWRRSILIRLEGSHGNSGTGQALVLDQFVALLRLFGDVHVAVAHKVLHSGGRLVAFRTFLQRNGAVEVNLETLAEHLGVVLLGLNAIVKFGVVAVEQHRLVPGDLSTAPAS